jgi:hypothetical protein
MRPLGIIAGRIKQLFRVTAECLSLGASTTLTVSSGAVTATKSFHKIDSPTTGTTNLTTINGGQQGNILVLMAADDAKTISARDSTGNLRLAGNFNLDNLTDTLTLMYDGAVWVELCRSNN